MRVIFMGTPDFAVPTLQQLVDSECSVVGVVCQPDRPSGRGKKIRFGPVKSFALDQNIPVIQPEKMKDPTFLETLRSWNPDVIVVAAFGRILPQVILDLPPKGCLNVHGSLLPKYRGAGPIQWAVINGEPVTGVTIMLMDAGMDTGAILEQAQVPISPEDTAGDVARRMAEVGGALLVSTLQKWMAGTVVAQPQNESEATLAPMLTKEDGLLDWSQSATTLANRIRGLSPWPGAHTFVEGERWGIWKARAEEDEGSDALLPPGKACCAGNDHGSHQDMRFTFRQVRVCSVLSKFNRRIKSEWPWPIISRGIALKPDCVCVGKSEEKSKI